MISAESARSSISAEIARTPAFVFVTRLRAFLVGLNMSEVGVPMAGQLPRPRCRKYFWKHFRFVAGSRTLLPSLSHTVFSLDLSHNLDFRFKLGLSHTAFSLD